MLQHQLVPRVAMKVAELNAEPPGGLCALISEPALNRGANFTTLMKHFASSGLCPTFTTLKTVTSGPMYFFYLTVEQFN